MLKFSKPLWLVVWAVAARLSSATADNRPTVTIAPRQTAVVNAAVPTGPGQIGVNPVEEDIGNPDIYRGTIQHLTATQSSLITVDSSTTRVSQSHQT